LHRLISRRWTRSQNQIRTNQNPDEATFGEPNPRAPPHSGLSHSEDRGDFRDGKNRPFSITVLSAEAGFTLANELIAAMDVLERTLIGFGSPSRGLVLDQKRGHVSRHSAALSQHNLINQHMMLARFAIETCARDIWRSTES